MTTHGAELFDKELAMLLEPIANDGCMSYLLACEQTREAVIIDPNQARLQFYVGLSQRHGCTIKYLIDTHTHADHFTAARGLRRALGAQLVMDSHSAAQDVDLRIEDGETLIVGELRLRAMYTPGHTSDSMCLLVDDRVFTGDTLLVGGTGRTDLPTGDPEMLYDSLFGRLLKLDESTLVYPAHDYKQVGASSIGRELANNARLQKRDRAQFVAMMRELNISAPHHLTEALRTNMNAARTVAELLSEAASRVSFMSLQELHERMLARAVDFILLDVRERNAFESGHIAGAKHLPRGQLELRVNDELIDPTKKILTICEFGKISTLAAATLRELGFKRAVALEGGMKAWREAGFPVESGAAPAPNQ